MTFCKVGVRQLTKGLAILLANALGLPSVFRRLNRKQVVILMYHGLVEDTRRSEWTQLSVGKFEQQIRHLALYYSPVSLEQAVEHLSGRTELPDNPVVVTFDDGYRSTYELGFPVLKKYGVPASVFITTSLLGHTEIPPRILWFDRVYSLTPRLLIGRVDLSHLGLPVFEISQPSDRQAAIDTICERLKRLGERERRSIIDALVKALAEKDAINDHYRGADWTQVRQCMPLMMPAAHTVNHEILSLLGASAAREEINLSKQIIEREVGAPIPFFAYPNGRREDFTDESRRLVIEAGFRAALTTIEGVNRAGDDLFALKRLGIGSDSTMLWFRLAVPGFLVCVRELLRRP